MKRLIAAVLLSLSASAAFAGSSDAAGCKDHPLFTRMPGYIIAGCLQSQFDAYDFPVSADVVKRGKSKEYTAVEGVQYYVRYHVKDDSVAKPSALQVARNFQNAVKAAGGTLVAEFGAYESGKEIEIPDDPGAMNYLNRGTTFKLVKGGKEIWALVGCNWDCSNYIIHVAEREAMKQDIVANDWLDQINKDGWVEIEINFDTGKATIKPESAGNVAQMVELLKANAALKVEVGGHTDNVGDAASNLKLSEARAKSVMDALLKGGIAAARLTAKGYGQTMPVADNRREAGRAKNRRVELVKK